MPQNGMAPESKRPGTRHSTCKANGHVPDMSLVNGAVVHNGWAGADTRTRPKKRQRDTVDLPVTANYRPVVHHPRPVPWPRYSIPTEQEQFADADEDTDVICWMSPAPPPMPPKEEENWENEIIDAKVPDWEKLTFGLAPYGPEDVLSFSLRDLTQRQRDTVELPVTANYRPVVHHPRPVPWPRYSIPTEQEQFADADE